MKGSFLKVSADSELILDGNMVVSNGIGSSGIWSCLLTTLVQGRCTLANGVAIQDDDGSVVKVVSVSGTLPGNWVATDSNTNVVVGNVSRSAGVTNVPVWTPSQWQQNILEQWDSRSPSYYNRGRTLTYPQATNKRGMPFILYLLPGRHVFAHHGVSQSKQPPDPGRHRF